MNKKNKGILIGMILGDGCLQKRVDKRCNYTQNSISIKHCIKQKEYLEHKALLLQKIFGGEKPNIREINNSGYPGCVLQKTDKYFRILYKLLYPNKKKTITRKALDYLNLQGIALWYMDDGSLTARKRNGKIHAYELVISTYISKEENQIIVDYFKEKWDINFKIVKGKGLYRIRCGTKEARKFLKLIKPYSIPCMEYKFNIK